MAPANMMAAVVMICSFVAFILKRCFNVNNWTIQIPFRFLLVIFKFTFRLRYDEGTVAGYLDATLKVIIRLDIALILEDIVANVRQRGWPLHLTLVCLNPLLDFFGGVLKVATQ
jgi:hypothetical protein